MRRYARLAVALVSWLVLLLVSTAVYVAFGMDMNNPPELLGAATGVAITIAAIEVYERLGRR